MSIDPEAHIAIPVGLHIVMWLEFLLFVPFSYQHYFGGFEPWWGKASTNGLVRMLLWSVEVSNGVGAVLIYYMLGSVLYQQSIALIEIELLFISHALWYGALVAVNAPGSGLLSFVLCTPHTYLCLGMIGTAYDLPRPICLMCSVGILLFGGYRRYYQIPTH